MNRFAGQPPASTKAPGLTELDCPKRISAYFFHLILPYE
jgi:hypothetical protein